MRRLDDILTLLKGLRAMNADVQAALETLRTEVAAEKTVEDSVVVLLGSLKSKLDDLASQVADQPAIAQAITDLAQGISANKEALAAAAVANTPSA